MTLTWILRCVGDLTDCPPMVSLVIELENALNKHFMQHVYEMNASGFSVRMFHLRDYWSNLI
jgi:plasmid replication initiation protein